VSFATKDPDGARSLCYVTGLTSSGKTTLLELLRPTLEPFGCRLLDFSSLLMRELGPPSGWETLELSKFAGAATRCAEELVSETPVVVAGHVFTRFAGQRIVLEGAWRTILPCSAVVFLDVRADQLIERSASRGRHLDENLLAEDAAFAIDQARHFTNSYQTPLHVMSNDSREDLVRNARQLAQILLDARFV
jgi:broad-specificity NMP kinase